MNTVYFATTNREKLLIAQTISKSKGITVEQARIDIDEIQGEDAPLIVKDKARRAYELFGKPLIFSLH